MAAFTSVDEYIAAQPQAAQLALQRTRATIRKAVPSADEVISYDMPTYKLKGERLLYFAGWKTYVSLYAAGREALTEFKAEVRPYVAEKGTLRFPLDEPLPEKLIERIAKFRAREITGDA